MIWNWDSGSGRRRKIFSSFHLFSFVLLVGFLCALVYTSTKSDIFLEVGV